MIDSYSRDLWKYIDSDNSNVQLNPFMPKGIASPNNWVNPFQILLGSILQFQSNFKSIFCEKKNAKSYQTPHLAASDLILPCMADMRGSRGGRWGGG